MHRMILSPPCRPFGTYLKNNGILKVCYCSGDINFIMNFSKMNGKFVLLLIITDRKA